MPDNLDLNTLVGERFTTLELTMGINKRQNEYGLLNGMGLFSEEGIPDRHVKIETRDQSLSIIPTSPVGTPAPADDDPDSRGVIQPIPTFRHAKKHTLLAESLQGVRAYGTDNEPEYVDVKMMEMLDKIQREHRQTKEFLRWGALKGNVYDADGSKLLYNVYDLMGETQHTIEATYRDPDSVDAIQDANDELLDYMEDNALGEVVTGVIKLCSPGYMEALAKNKAFREAFKAYQNDTSSINPNRQSARRPFEFKDVIYLRHRGKCSFKKKDGTTVTHQFIPDGEAIALPLGTTECFRTFFGPAEFLETVNTIGKEIYVKPKLMDLDMGIELHSFSHALNLVTKPRLVVKCTVAAAP